MNTKKTIVKLVLLVLVTFSVAPLLAQNQPYYNDIQKFKQRDSLNFPPKNAIVFTGSSSFTKWQDVQEYFPNHTIINRGFGGSSLPHVIRYANDIVIPYHPKQVVIYCGDNDLASSDTVTPRHVLERFTTLFNIIRSNNKNTSVVFVSIKPSPSRARIMDRMAEANGLVKEFLKTKKNTGFVDVYTPMLLADGSPDPSLFLEDNLHMNEKGYAIWQKAIEPYLKK